ncbi:MAG TPA: UDP-N-acetylglucosamine 2-epimerase [Negativicutes bacterium]|nr:UDP-N-acetylglucosamine 2-epimerase [Negativicutes bacterium]
MKEKRKICVVTGTRAEYGLLSWLLREISQDPALKLQIIATGAHLSPDFGLTYRTIEADGFAIDAKVEMLLASDTPIGIAKSIGLGVIGFADALAALKPDILVLLGDRYEILAAAQAALVARIPVAHIHGGEITEGAFDDAIRHALTKMAHLHFVAAEPYRRRVIQLGEDPARVFNFGAPGLDSIRKLTLLDRTELETALGFTFGPVNLLVTYHPVTLADEDPREAMVALLQALDAFPQAKIIFTRPNADTHGRMINELIDRYIDARPGRAAAYVSLGQLKYLSAIRQVDAVIGNSSSGLSEAPALKKPTVNIGARQSGRLRAASVIDCAAEQAAIMAAIRQALSAEFAPVVQAAVAPYGAGDASRLIKEQLKNTPLAGLAVKKFHDLD